MIKLRAQINLDGQVVARAGQALNMSTDLYSTGGFTQLYDTNQWDLKGGELQSRAWCVFKRARALGSGGAGLELEDMQFATVLLAGLQNCAEGVSAVRAIGAATQSGQRVFSLSRDLYEADPTLVYESPTFT